MEATAVKRKFHLILYRVLYSSIDPSIDSFIDSNRSSAWFSSPVFLLSNEQWDQLLQPFKFHLSKKKDDTEL
jgi:hypothetical protein